jgi:NAD-dependent DNA ligase
LHRNNQYPEMPSAKSVARKVASTSGTAPGQLAGTKRKLNRADDAESAAKEFSLHATCSVVESPAPAFKKLRKSEEHASSIIPPARTSSGWSGKGQVVLFTGFRDAELERVAKIQSAGVAASFTKAVTLLVTADTGVDNAKTKEAATKNVPVMTADEFAAALGVARTGKATKSSHTKAAAHKKVAGDGQAHPHISNAGAGGANDGVEEEEVASKKVKSKSAPLPAMDTAPGAWSPDGQVVVFSGFRDKAFEDAVIAGGGSIVGSVTKAVTLLVSNDPKGENGKVKEARMKDVRVVSNEEFGAMIHTAPSQSHQKACRGQPRCCWKSASRVVCSWTSGPVYWISSRKLGGLNH